MCNGDFLEESGAFTLVLLRSVVVGKSKNAVCVLLIQIDAIPLNVQGGDVNIRDENGNLIAGTSLLPYIAWDVVHYAIDRMI